MERKIGLKSNANWKKYYWLDVVKLFEMFMRSNQYSSNLATMGMGRPIHMKQYESRFKQCLLPDVVHLENADFDLHIPENGRLISKRRTDFLPAVCICVVVMI